MGDYCFEQGIAAIVEGQIAHCKVRVAPEDGHSSFPGQHRLVDGVIPALAHSFVLKLNGAAEYLVDIHRVLMRTG